MLDNRARHFAEFVRGLGDDLPDDVDTRTATDLLWALSNGELWRELVDERGWSPDRYERWLAATLVAQHWMRLLPSANPVGRAVGSGGVTSSPGVSTAPQVSMTDALWELFKAGAHPSVGPGTLAESARGVFRDET